MKCHRPGYFRMPRVMQDNPVIREKASNLERYIHNAESGLPIFEDDRRQMRLSQPGTHEAVRE